MPVDLSEHRLHHLLSQSVRRFEAAVVDLFAHQLRRRSTNFSVCRCRVLGASRVEQPQQVTLLLMGEITQARAYLDRALALYDPSAHRLLATRFGQDVEVSIS